HADGRAHHAAAGVRQSEEFQRALQGAVLAAGSMQRDEHPVELARHQFGQRLFLRVERMRVDAALQQRGETGIARLQRDLALARGATQQQRHAPELARIGDVTDDFRVVSQAHQSGSPTVRNSGTSFTPDWRSTSCWISATRRSTSAAVADSTFTRKLACLGETMMSPMRVPLRPAASIRRAAWSPFGLVKVEP